MSTPVSQTPSTWRTKVPQLALILITIIWGGSFITVQYGLHFSSPVIFVGLRFAAAAIAVTLLSLKHLKGITLKEVAAGALIGAVIAIGYGTQTVGLQTISSSESAFLTALYVPLVPLLLWLLFRKKPHFMTWIGALFAFLGLVFLTGPKVNTRRVTVLQLIFASLFCFLMAPMLGETQLPDFHWHLAGILVGLGIVSACIQLVMNWAQEMVDPSQAAIIYAGEPIWASLFGRMAGERLPALALLGGLMVVLGVIPANGNQNFSEKKK